jgi:hypothetical protein
LKLFVKFLLFSALFWGCDTEKPLPVDTGAAYFPLGTRVYQIYTVDEVVYSPDMEPQVSAYQLRAEVVDSFPSGEGGYTYVIHRSKRATDADPWEALDTWSARSDGREAVVAEGNRSFVKLTFPLQLGSRWNGNTFNSLGADEYQVTEFDRAMELDGILFDKTVTVEQENNEDLIVFTDERREVYASEVGLVFKEVRQLHYCTEDHCLGQQKIDHGMELKMVIKQYGKH